MFKVDKPNLNELPSLAMLRRYTLVAAIGAVLILVAAVLPAEYGIDPTGAGRILGLTEMGKIKVELAHEAEKEEQDHHDHQSSYLYESLVGLFVGTARAAGPWRDTKVFVLKPGESTETKLVMKEGQQAQYKWKATGGRINFDLHAHGPGKSKTYEKGRGKTGGEGRIVAPFSGDHGWFWRNRDKQDVEISLRISGEYLEFVTSK